MKIKIGDKVKWMGKEFTVTAIHPMPFAVCSLTDSDEHEEYLLRNNLESFIRENQHETTTAIRARTNNVTGKH